MKKKRTINIYGQISPTLAEEIVACERAFVRWQELAVRKLPQDRFPFHAGYAEAIEDIRSGRLKIEDE